MSHISSTIGILLPVILLLFVAVLAMAAFVLLGVRKRFPFGHGSHHHNIKNETKKQSTHI